LLSMRVVRRSLGRNGSKVKEDGGRRPSAAVGVPIEASAFVLGPCAILYTPSSSNDAIPEYNN
jgi:hypothetical protein